MKIQTIIISLVVLLSPKVVISEEIFPEFTDVSIELFSWLDLMPRIILPGEDPNAKKEAIFLFKLGISNEEFREKYEIKNISINGENIELDKEFYYQEEANAFRLETVHYERGLNDVEILIFNKEINQNYIKKISQELEYTY